MEEIRTMLEKVAAGEMTVEDAVLEFYALFSHVELEDDQLAALFTD